MTPKEKAKELFEKMYYKIPVDELGKDNESAKQCALIAVNEIISFIEDDRDWFIWKNYYKEVKQEIKKL